MATPDDDYALCQDFTTEGAEFESCAEGICNLYPIRVSLFMLPERIIGGSI